MTKVRHPGYVKINGEPYVIVKDKDGIFQYDRRSNPKSEVNIDKTGAKAGKSNLVEIQLGSRDGFGDENMPSNRDSYHYATNFYMTGGDEFILLPGARPLVPPDTDSTNDFELPFSPPVAIVTQRNESNDDEVLIIQDHRAFLLYDDTNTMEYNIDTDIIFDATTQPTDAVVYKNELYVATGGGKNGTSDRFLRKRNPDTGQWTNDAHYTGLTIIAAANNGSGAPRFETNTDHTITLLETVYISDSSVSAYNGLWTVTQITDTTHFDVQALTYTATCVANVNIQDSDVQAEQLAIQGDLMIRTFWDGVDGWQVSRVDALSSDPLLDANWSGGIQIVHSTADQDETPTDLVVVGDGELIMMPDGVYTLDPLALVYTNSVPELISHRHPDNGKGSFEHKGWVYIPTSIGLLRWKNNIIQDVTPGRNRATGQETPIGPVAWVTGDASRLYAITQAFREDLPTEATSSVVKFATDLTGSGTITVQADVTDAVKSTSLDISSIRNYPGTGYLYVGCTKKFHRVHFELSANILRKTSMTDDVNVLADYYNGTAWTSRAVLQDGTRGTALGMDTDSPCPFNKTGDIVFNTPVNIATGEDDWAVGAPAADNELDSSFYWMRFTLDATAHTSAGGLLQNISVGIHNTSTFEPMMTNELPNDHGGVVYVLEMTEEPGSGGPKWNTLWAFVVPDVDRTTGLKVGGAQKVGACAVVQPQNETLTGESWLLVGMETISYLCPLGTDKNPTNTQHRQWLPNTDEGINGGTRPCTIVWGDTDCGLKNEIKTLKEIEFYSEDIELSSTEIYYRVDHGAWTFIGFGDDLTPNMPIVFTPGSEPSGHTFAIAISTDGEPNTNQKLGRIYSPILRVQPRPKMVETISMTLELDAEMTQPGTIDRRTAANRYSDLKTLEEGSASVTYTDIDGSTGYLQILQVSKKFIHNSDNVPAVVASVIATVTSTRTEAA